MVRKIHYCWFGGEKPDAVKRNVDAWAALNPGFEIIEWNESNIDVSAWEFGRRAQESHRWGFLADIIRLEKLVEQGGFYADADVEMIRPLALLDTSENSGKLLMGYMYPCALGTAVLYAPPEHRYLRDILRAYNYIRPDVFPVNNSLFTAYFINRVDGFLLNGKPWQNGECRLFSKECFEQPSFIRTHGISIHHCCGSWQKAFSGSFDFRRQRTGLRHLMKWASRQYRVWRAAGHNEFTPGYRAAIKGVRLPYDLLRYYTTASPYPEE